MKIRNLAGGFVVALFLSLPSIVPYVAGIATWKIEMGLVGLWIFVTAGIRGSSA